MNDRLIRCIACGARVPSIPDAEQSSATVVATGCRELFTRILTEPEGPRGSLEYRLLTSAAWALQHPGRKSADSIREVNAQLITLCAALDYRIRSEAVTELASHAIRRYRPDFTWLEPPRWPGPLTVADVAEEQDPDSRLELARDWALGVYRAWESYHDIVKGYLKGVFASS